MGSQTKYIVWGDVYTDASNYQLGAVIMQENKPLAFLQEKNGLRAQTGSSYRPHEYYIW